MNAPAPMTLTAADLMEIAQALNITKRSAERRAQSWPFVSAPVKGGHKRYYALDSLPKAVREAVQRQRHEVVFAQAKSCAPTLPAIVESKPLAKRADGSVALRGQHRRPKDPAALNDKDRAYQDNALMLCNAVDEAVIGASCSEKTAIRELAQRIVSETARPELIAASLATYLKPRRNAPAHGGEAALISRLQKMMAFYRAGQADGNTSLYLIAGRPEKTGQKHEDVVAFLRHYCHPSRPSVMLAWKNAAPWYAAQGLDQPAVDTWYRIEKTLPVTVKNRGRMTGAAFKSLLPFVSRDVSMFKANDIWVGDGHTFKARVRSPLTGKAFRPEVTVIIDWVSRKAVGWSVDLAESTIAVSAALRNAQINTRARPLIYYSDNGSGQTGKKIDHPVTGTAARQGFAHETGIPGSPQGRGIIERLWTTLLFPLAKSYPTVLTKDADRDHIRLVTQALAKADRAAEFSPLLPSFEQFVADLQAAINHYNSTHKHSELGGMTPNEAYAAKLDPDSLVFGIDDTEINALWMPEEIRSTSRGRIELYNNVYFRRDLPDIVEEGEYVRVRFDIHEPKTVWIYRMDGREIGPAEWDGNKVAAFPVAYVEKKRQERAGGIIKKANKEIDRANAELGNTIDNGIVLGGGVLDLAQALTPRAAPELQEREAAPAVTPAPSVAEAKPEEAPKTRSRGDLPPQEVMAEWHGINTRLLAGEMVSEGEANWHSAFQRHSIFRSAFKTAAFSIAKVGGSESQEERWASA